MKCLIFANDPVIAFICEQAAARIDCESLTVSNAADARRAVLGDDRFDLAVVDHAPPGIDAVGWCRSLGSGEDRRRHRVIVLAPAEDLFDLQRTEDAGIDDLVVKPLQKIELELRLRANQRILELEAQVEAGMRALQAQATHDVLTGALNQTAVREALRRECDRSSRDHSPLAAIAIEVDDLESCATGRGPRRRTRCWWKWPRGSAGRSAPTTAWAVRRAPASWSASRSAGRRMRSRWRTGS